jgi:hypothetical protein
VQTLHRHQELGVSNQLPLRVHSEPLRDLNLQSKEAVELLKPKMRRKWKSSRMKSLLSSMLRWNWKINWQISKRSKIRPI